MQSNNTAKRKSRGNTQKREREREREGGRTGEKRESDMSR
jgi:hypothetical protein